GPPEERSGDGCSVRPARVAHIRGHHGTTTEWPLVLRQDGSVATVLPAAMSAREAEVLSALGEHLTNAEIGQRLHISVRTVESLVSPLLRKLGAADRRELAAMAEQAAPASATTP